MHGLIIGHDGRLYFSIGDRGYNVDTPTGKLFDPESGAVFRCELDGSNLEVFATGLRNPQELAFDDHGYLFTGDNNSDSGDKARWVNVMEGGDTGWRMMYQYLPDRGPFNRDKIWQPFSAETPAYTIPPIENISDGPSGLNCYPGHRFNGRLSELLLLSRFPWWASEQRYPCHPHSTSGCLRESRTQRTTDLENPGNGCSVGTRWRSLGLRLGGWLGR